MKKAFTLIELLVYMIIMGFIIVVAGRVFSDSTGMRVRSQNMVKSMEEAGQVATFIKEDVSKMGAKTHVSETSPASEAGNTVFDAPSEVYINYQGCNNNSNSDVSSFELTRNAGGNGLDSLSFLKVEYNEDGTRNSVRRIAWFVEGGALMRICQVIGNGGNSDCDGENIKVEMARGVKRFQFFASRPSIGGNNLGDTLMFDNAFKLLARDAEAGKYYKPGITSNNIGPFEKNEENGSVASQLYLASSGSDWKSCHAFPFAENEMYALEFNLGKFLKDNKMSRFQPSKDHLSVGIRSKEGAPLGVPDFMFYPVLNSGDQEKRYFEFSVPSGTANACIAITAAFYSPEAHLGSINFSEFKVYRKHDKAYSFDRNLNYPEAGSREKAFVKAFELNLTIEKGGEANETKIVIPVPNNGVCIAPEGAT